MPVSTSDTITPERLNGSAFATYRIGGPLQEAYQPASMDEAVAVLQSVRQDEKPLTVIGWGSNSIISSQGVSGATMITRKLTHIEQKSETTFVLGAGVHLAKVATLAQKQCLSGAEYMIGIPATLGGAVRMNAGAMGQETSSVVRYAFVFNMDSGELEIWESNRLGYRYRHSDLDPTKHVVLAGELAFHPGDVATITELMDKNVQFRKTHHPIEPNAGSVFRNPTGHTVGKLLDDLNAKSWREGGVRISPLHANFIVNTGEGTSLDVLRLMNRMQDAVLKEYDLHIMPENVYLGEMTDEEQSLWAKLTQQTH